MNNRFGKYIFLFLFIGCIKISAQIEIYGLIDVEYSKGGKDSNFGVNDIAADYKDPHVAINQMNLFLFSQINESFSVNLRLQFDTWGTGELNPLRLSLAEITWEPPESSVSISVGRFVNPFGLYPQRQLSIQNSLVNTPLAYGYGVNISDRYGLSSVNADGYQYGGYGDNLTTISFAGYSTGFLFRWLLLPQVLNLDVALSNVAPASQKNYTNIKNLAVITRLSFQPAIFWQQGVSFSYGSFMQEDTLNQSLGDLTKFKQTLIGTDWIISYTYFELSGEFIYAIWNVPGLVQDTYYGNSEWTEYNLENFSYYIDLKYELPFLAGIYIAVRYEELKFMDIDQPYGTTPVYNGLWQDDVRRYTIGVGYKFSPDIQIKVAYSDQKNITDSYYDSVYIQPEAYTLRAMLSASF